MLRRGRARLVDAATIGGAAFLGLPEPAGAVVVSTEAELKFAFESETQIDVQADIVLTDCRAAARSRRDPDQLDGQQQSRRWHRNDAD